MNNEQQYVVMTNTFLSGTGLADFKIVKHCIECDNEKQSKKVIRCRGINKTDIEITKEKPAYHENIFYVYSSADIWISEYQRIRRVLN